MKIWIIIIQVILLGLIIIIYRYPEQLKPNWKQSFKTLGSMAKNYLDYKLQNFTNSDWNLRIFNKYSYLKNDVTIFPDKNMLVIIAHYNENLEWTKNLIYPYKVISREGLPKETIPNKGNEASIYLEYIISNYNNLPDICIFVHGHRNDWHHASYIDQKIYGLEFKYKYYNINEAPIGAIDNEESFVSELLQEIRPIVGLIDHTKIFYRKSAQFYVFKELILSHSLQYYKELLNWLWASTHSSYKTGRIMEYIWHYIFTGSYHDIL